MGVPEDKRILIDLYSYRGQGGRLMSISPGYREFLERLECYRTRTGMTQAEFARRAGVTQSQISKQKKGLNIVTFEVLDMLDKNGCDVSYLLTGKKYTRTVLDEYYEQCQPDERDSLMELMIWGVGHSLMQQETQRSSASASHRRMLAERIKYLQLRLQNEEARESVWYGLRAAHDLSQKQMAELIRVDIKKYVRIEKGRTKPDAEILLEIYERWGMSPNVILERKNGDLQELNALWHELHENRRSKVLKLIQFSEELFFH